MSRLRPGPRLFVVVLAVLTCLLGSQASALASAWADEYDTAGYLYDVEANIAQVETDAAGASAVRTVGRQGDAKPSVVSAWHRYAASHSFVAPSGIRVASSGVDVAPMSTVRTIGRGERVTDLVNEAKSLTFTTGNEHAVVKLANGDRVLISGGSGGIKLTTDVTLVYGHTHPYGVLSNGSSPGDYAMLDELDQPFSYVIDNGEIIRFNRGGG